MEDLTFEENFIILAHPAKDQSSPWEYGTLVATGEKGWFPSSYVLSIEHGESGFCVKPPTRSED